MGCVVEDFDYRVNNLRSSPRPVLTLNQQALTVTDGSSDCFRVLDRSANKVFAERTRIRTNVPCVVASLLCQTIDMDEPPLAGVEVRKVQRSTRRQRHEPPRWKVRLNGVLVGWIDEHHPNVGVYLLLRRRSRSRDSLSASP